MKPINLDVRIVNQFLYELIDKNPIGEHNRIEEIFDMVLFRADKTAKNYFEGKAKEWPDTYEDLETARGPFMVAEYLKFVDEDRKALFKKLKEKNDVDEGEVLSAVIKAMEKIRQLDGKKELMNRLSENGYEKCLLNLVLYELVK